MPKFTQKLNSIIAISAILSAFPTIASAGEFGVGAAIGTTGATIEAKTSFADKFMVRGSFNYLEFNTDQDYDGIDYDADLNLTTFGGFVDFAPFGNAFVLSGGAYFGEKSLDLLANPTGPVNIGDETFSPEQVGTLVGEVKLKSVAPYLGLGYDSFLTSKSNWSFNARAGVMFTGSPEPSLTSMGGTLSDNATLQEEIRAEVDRIRDDADNYKYYPVVSIGVTRQF